MNVNETYLAYERHFLIPFILELITKGDEDAAFQQLIAEGYSSNAANAFIEQAKILGAKV